MADLLTSDQLLQLLEGNRRLTIRAIEAFPEEQLFTYAPAEPLRSFADMVKEILSLEADYVKGIATKEWVMGAGYGHVNTKAGLIAACEQVRTQTLNYWPQISVERLLNVEADNFFGTSAIPNLDRLVYALENEVHHRGQGFVYLRLLGIEPPAFYER